MAKRPSTDHELIAKFTDGAGFLAGYKSSGNGAFALPSRPLLIPNVGSRVAIRVTFLHRKMDFRIICRIATADEEEGTIWVTIEPGQETPHKMILACARGEPVPMQRRKHIRVPAVHRVDVREKKNTVRAFTMDVSDEGLRIVGALNPGVGANLQLRVRAWALLFPLPIWLHGEVTSSLHVAGGRHTLGIMLRFKSKRHKTAWRRLVEHARQQAWA